MSSGSFYCENSRPTAFTSQTRCNELWFMSPPTIHQTALATGGLNAIFQRIRSRNLEPTRTSSDEEPDSDGTRFSDLTDNSGQFSPRCKMELMAQRYFYLETLARGHTAVVIKAQDTFRGKQSVVIKVLHAHFYLIGGQEAEILREVNLADADCVMPIIRLRNYFRMADHYCLVFDECYPEPLNDRFLKRGWVKRKSLKPIRKVASRLLTAVSFLHQRNVIHADLKPENILRVQDEWFPHSLDICIADFGNSIRCTPDEIELYEEDYELQTLSYRAPEVILGVNIDLTIDLWSIGCILAELYIGRPLFYGLTKEDVLEKMVDLMGPLPTEFLGGKYGKEFERFTGETVSHKELDVRLQKHLECTDCGFVRLVSGLLRYQPDDRISILDASCSSFLAQEYPLEHMLRLQNNGAQEPPDQKWQEANCQKPEDIISLEQTKPSTLSDSGSGPPRKRVEAPAASTELNIQSIKIPRLHSVKDECVSEDKSERLFDSRNISSDLPEDDESKCDETVTNKIQQSLEDAIGLEQVVRKQTSER